MTASGGEVRATITLDGKLVTHTGRPVDAARLLSADESGRLRVTFVPRIAGGAGAATLTGVPAKALLPESVRLELESFEVRNGRAHAVYLVKRPEKLARRRKASAL